MPRRSQVAPEHTPRRKRFSIKPRFYIFMAVAAALLIWGVVALFNLFAPPVVEWGRLETVQDITALVLRDETIMYSPEQVRIMCIAAEGEQVEEGNTIAMLYKSGYNEKNMQNLITLQQKIKDYQENQLLADYKLADLETLGQQIDGKLEEIRVAAAQSKTGALLGYERELKEMMLRRQDLLAQNAQPDDYLQKLYDQETGLKQKIDETRIASTAQISGYVSYIFDGLEAQLRVDNIANMTPKDVTNLEGQVLRGDILDFSSGLRKKDEPLCRIVRSDVWYALVVMSKSRSTMTAGAVCQVQFDGLSDPVEGTVVQYVPDGNQVLAVLEIHEGAQNITSLRRITGHVGRSAEGFRVPLESLVQVEGGQALQVQGAEGVVTVMVDVMASDTRQAVVAEAKGSGGVLSVGQRIIMP